MRDVLMIPFNGEGCVIAASDNSGGIGLKEMDAVHVPYSTVGYFSFRVAVMECIAAGGAPFAVIVQNFCGDQAWNEIVAGIVRGLREVGLEDMGVNGSTESNFSLLQSAIGLTVLGKKENGFSEPSLCFAEGWILSVIGKPLVGEEVILQSGEVAPLSLFRTLALMEDVVLFPVGSKGILYELNQCFSDRTFAGEEMASEIDLFKSSGPSTCFLAIFPSKKEGEVKEVAGCYFNKIEVVNQ